MRCQVKRCKDDVYIIFYGFSVCESCWGKHCSNVFDLKRLFKVKDEIFIKSDVDINKISLADDWKSYFKGDG